MITSGFSASIRAGVASTPSRMSVPRLVACWVSQRVMPVRASRQVALAAMVIWPPVAAFFSNSTTEWPRSAQTRAASSPPGPPPTTTTRFFASALGMTCGIVRSRPVAAFWMHKASPPA